MKAAFYPKLAWDAMRKNKRIYFPYILTGSVMAMMHYILGFLQESPALAQMSGGSMLMTILPMGSVVVGVFALLFLFYTNSFLMKQRYREFGLYSILGMDKRNIGRLMLWETAFTAALAIAAGLLCGAALSKAAELVLLNLLNMKVDFKLSLGASALQKTALLFAAIYAVLLVNSLIRIGRSKPLELVQSSKVGERIPKRTWALAVIGLALLGGAYYLAVAVEEPATALFMFFIAVLLVIVGTYLVFISGSVALCRLLQKNKKYYYQPNHFVSVSSMVYRMKRNGAGLASICILLTMVLVMLSSTTALYFGEEDSIRNRYPDGVNIRVSYGDAAGIGDESLDALRRAIAPYCPEGTAPEGVRYGLIAGMFTDVGITVDYASVENFTLIDYDKVGCLYVVSLADYNRMAHADRTLDDGECLLYTDRLTTQWDAFTLQYGGAYRVRERLSEFPERGDALVMTMPSVYLVVRDMEAFIAPIAGMKNTAGASMVSYDWLCGFDIPTPEEEIAAAIGVRSVLAQMDGTISSYDSRSREAQRDSFFELYGSLFFLGMMLSVVFLLAAVLIIYYKQISEGYEDKNRFEIMQKVGMTKKDIRRSINSQMLTVFFLPLAAAGVHLAFAFPFISKILLLFAFNNMLLNALVTFACFAIFGLLYAAVYKITSGAYCAIVSGRKERS